MACGVSTPSQVNYTQFGWRAHTIESMLTIHVANDDEGYGKRSETNNNMATSLFTTRIQGSRLILKILGVFEEGVGVSALMIWIIGDTEQGLPWNSYLLENDSAVFN